MKILKFLKENSLLALTLFLLAFIPLYPKLPLLGVQYTWVYIRIEDIFVLLTVTIWAVQLLKKRASLNTPLTIPILAFWLLGALSSIYGVLFIFPHLPNAHPSLAFFYWARQVEYLILFFVAFSAMKSKRFVTPTVVVLSLTLLAVFIYGWAQKGIVIGSFTLVSWANRFPAFSTMNEEFAKGVPLKISQAARVSSTFAGHYDLAAYLVLLIPIMGSMVFGYKKWYLKIFFIGMAVLGLVLLLMTASRVSYGVYLMSITFLLILQKQKKFIIPVVIASILLVGAFQGIAQRFGSTFSQVDLVVDARTGKPIGIAKQITNSATTKKIVIQDIQSTGENLPQGSQYIDIPSKPVQQYKTEVVYTRQKIEAGKQQTQTTTAAAEVVVKKAFAYDVSFTTRFQGEWPRAFEAFRRNIVLGSGYSSINLATDNNFLRILGETGVLGFCSFLLIFMIMGIYIWRVLPEVTSVEAKSLALGLTAGIFGLTLNAALIDVFEASKVALVLWMLVGVTIGLLHLYKTKSIDYLSDLKAALVSPLAIFIYSDLKAALVSPLAIFIYLCIASFSIFYICLDNYFVADDFTWLRWVADCKKVLYQSGAYSCEPFKTTILHFFTDSLGFFYRPGTKLLFFLEYPFFQLIPSPYHIASIFAHFLTTFFVYLISLKLLKNKLFSSIVAVFFLVLSIHAESIFWISATGHLISSLFLLVSLYLFIKWREGRQMIFFPASILSVFISSLFYELAVVAPLLLILYDLIFEEHLSVSKLKHKWYYIAFFVPILLYNVLRTRANSLWFQGDYSYNLQNLPYNVFGNILGYLSASIAGNKIFPLYEQLRMYGAANKGVILVAVLAVCLLLIVAYRMIVKRTSFWAKHMIFFGFSLFLVPLLPFLGLGNVAPRYDYLASFGFVFIFVLLIWKLYEEILKIDKKIAVFVLSVIIIFYSYLNVSDLHSANNDWQTAGKITQNFSTALRFAFPRTTSLPPTLSLFFLNAPIKYGQAWVFPVGLPDAVWFSFQDAQSLKVAQPKSLEDAFTQAEATASAKVYEFESDGTISEVHQTKTQVPIK